MKKYTLLGWNQANLQISLDFIFQQLPAAKNGLESAIRSFEFPMDVCGFDEAEENYVLTGLEGPHDKFNLSWFVYEVLEEEPNPTNQTIVDFPTKLRNEIWPLVKNAQSSQYDAFYLESKYNAECVDGRLATLKEMIKLIERLDCEK